MDSNSCFTVYTSCCKATQQDETQQDAIQQNATQQPKIQQDVHRDLKPSNLLLNTTCDLKVTQQPATQQDETQQDETQQDETQQDEIQQDTPNKTFNIQVISCYPITLSQSRKCLNVLKEISQNPKCTICMLIYKLSVDYSENSDDLANLNHENVKNMSQYKTYYCEFKCQSPKFDEDFLDDFNTIIDKINLIFKDKASITCDNNPIKDRLTEIIQSL
jgi:hypothetical protein